MKEVDQVVEMDTYSILMQSPVATGIFMGKDYKLAFANNLYLEILGKDKSIVGQPLFESFPDLIGSGIDVMIDQVIESGIPFTVDEHEVSMLRNGHIIPCFFKCVYQPLKDHTGTIKGVIVAFIDIIEEIKFRKIQIEHQKKLKSDLNIVNQELAFQKDEKRKRATELGIANIELAFQDKEKGMRASELDIANIELAFQDLLK